jgi:hypothetical protein
VQCVSELARWIAFRLTGIRHTSRQVRLILMASKASCRCHVNCSTPQKGEFRTCLRFTAWGEVHPWRGAVLALRHAGEEVREVVSMRSARSPAGLGAVDPPAAHFPASRLALSWLPSRTGCRRALSRVSPLF